MLNEGLIVNDTAALVRSEIVNQIRRLGPTTPDELERAVFKALTGHDREEVDWDQLDELDSSSEDGVPCSDRQDTVVDCDALRCKCIQRRDIGATVGGIGDRENGI